ncbi:uncharacterized protein LOC141618704 [Silene latifolia]|uniref:uncharacterized protein LOC141618704 n=1 Tax=Silene latifolia TaxID=37657 RepID=UPI003D785C08
MVLGAEVVIPLEVLVPTHRYECMTRELNQTEMIRSLDTIDELRTSARICLASYKQSVARSYDKNVRIRLLEVGDLVLRKVFQNTKNHKAGKFAHKWEGPYKVEGFVGHDFFLFLRQLLFELRKFCGFLGSMLLWNPMRQHQVPYAALLAFP